MKKTLELNILNPGELWTSSKLAGRAEILRLLFRPLEYRLRSVLIPRLNFVQDETVAQVSQLLIDGYLLVGDTCACLEHRFS